MAFDSGHANLYSNAPLKNGVEQMLGFCRTDVSRASSTAAVARFSIEAAPLRL
jgi:hypothetical protein